MAKNEELQRQTQRVLAELGTSGKPLSARGAGDRLGIGYNQIADMLKGKAPAEKTLMKFASAVGEPAGDWLRYAGKTDFAATLAAPSSPSDSHEQRIAQHIARDLMRISPELQPLLLRQIRALLRATENAEDK